MKTDQHSTNGTCISHYPDLRKLWDQLIYPLTVNEAPWPPLTIICQEYITTTQVYVWRFPDFDSEIAKDLREGEIPGMNYGLDRVPVGDSWELNDGGLGAGLRYPWFRDVCSRKAGTLLYGHVLHIDTNIFWYSVSRHLVFALIKVTQIRVATRHRAMTN